MPKLGDFVIFIIYFLYDNVYFRCILSMFSKQIYLFVPYFVTMLVLTLLKIRDTNMTHRILFPILL